MKFGTKAVHAGVEPDPTTGAIMTPIYQTSTYVQAAPGDHKGYEYSRTGNPTRNALENAIAQLENGTHGACFGSGMAAIDCVIKMLKPGDEVISTNDLYGGTYRLFTKIYEGFGIKFHFVPMGDVEAVKAKVNANTRLIWVETPTNPMMNIVDIEAMAKIAKGAGALLAVDNTFATPALQQPLDMGADIIMHSVVKDDTLAERMYFIQNSSGAVCGPMDSFLVLRGLKTLSLRMKQHCINGKGIANFLKGHPKVDKVYWPGFETHPNHLVAKRQMSGFGGMVSFTLKENTIAAANKVLSNTHLFALAESLGGVESLIGHPASMTHASIPKEEREKTGVVDSLIRLSMGIEDAEDLIDDLKAALE